jgi:hypothetical protein
LSQGMMVTVTEHHVRLHHLPLRRSSSTNDESP